METKESKVLTITHSSIPGVSVKLWNVNALSGSGCKRADWFEYLHAALREEFERHSSAGVHMSCILLQYIGVPLLHQDESPFGAEELDPSSRSNGLIRYFIASTLLLGSNQCV